MPDEDKNFGGSLVLDFRKWWRYMKTIYCYQACGTISTIRQHTHMRAKETLFVNTDFYLNLRLFSSLSQETHSKWYKLQSFPV